MTTFGGLRVERRGKGKWWAVNEPLDKKAEYRGPFDQRGEAEAALLDLIGFHMRLVEQSDGWYLVSGVLEQEMPTQGPIRTKGEAEILMRELIAGVREATGLPPNPDGPVDHYMAGVLLVDHGQEKATKPRDLGKRPEDFEARKERAAALLRAADAHRADDFDLLLAAWQWLDRDKGDTHHTLLLTHARAMFAWLERPEGPVTELAQLEGKMRTLAGLLSHTLTQSEEYVLLVTNRGEGENSFFSHCASLDRPTLIGLLDEYVGKLKQLERRHS